MKAENISRNCGFDILKCICTFLIICIHAPFPGEIGKYIVALARIAVPIFFMITGFYYKKISQNKKENYQIKKIIKLIVISNIIYLFFDIIKCNDYTEIKLFINGLLSIKTIIKLVFLNESPFYTHLWYLNSILYVLIIYKFIPIESNEKIKKIVLFVTPILLFFDLCFGKYSLLFFNREFNYLYLRNFIFVGFPYFTIGYFLNTYMSNKKTTNSFFDYLFILLFIIMTIIERFLLEKCNINAVRDHYLSTTFLSISLFIIFYNLNYYNRIMVLIGKKLSTYIYILHPIVIVFLTKIACSMDILDIYLYLQPIIVFFVSLLISLLVYKLNIMRMKKNSK